MICTSTWTGVTLDWRPLHAPNVTRSILGERAWIHIWEFTWVKSHTRVVTVKNIFLMGQIWGFTWEWTQGKSHIFAKDVARMLLTAVIWQFVWASSYEISYIVVRFVAKHFTHLLKLRVHLQIHKARKRIQMSGPSWAHTRLLSKKTAATRFFFEDGFVHYMSYLWDFEGNRVVRENVFVCSFWPQCWQLTPDLIWTLTVYVKKKTQRRS